MADLTKREKVYESVVQARIDACYLLAREFARTHGHNLDFDESAHVFANTSNLIIPIVPEEIQTAEHQKLKLRAGSVEFIRLTTDSTLFQVFIGDPVWSLVASADGKGPAGVLKKASESAPDYIESVWLGLLGRFRALNLVTTHRITSSQAHVK
ncbi:MAG: hypothetical protein FJ317_05915 [SAR202 cluster bacterium]|nr:hypothetical protein [SAR202 cluster bacterium]